MYTRLACRVILSLLCIGLIGCAPAYQVEAPTPATVSLVAPSNNAKVDFLIETEDMIGRNRSLGQIGNTFWGGQYQVVLTTSLKDYLEAEVVQEIRKNNMTCYRYTDRFTMSRMQFEEPPLHLKLELQDLTLSRHPKSHIFSEQVIAVCKIRAVLFDHEQNPVYQRQIVRTLDTIRLSDDLMLPLTGLISRKGISRLLEVVLSDTVRELSSKAGPEMRAVLYEYRENAANFSENNDIEDGYSNDLEYNDSNSSDTTTPNYDLKEEQDNNADSF